MNPLHRDNSNDQEQLQQWLRDADVQDLSANEQDQISQLLAELQDLPPAALSPQLEGRLQSLSQLQPTPSQPFKRLLALLAASFAVAGSFIAWQFSGLELQVAQKEAAPAVSPPVVPSTPTAASSSNKEFLLTSTSEPEAQATVTIRPEQATNLLVVKGLAPLPAGKTYRLWAETPLGQQGCMTFQPDADGNARIRVPREPSGSALRLVISIDPIQAGSAAEEPAQPVLTSV
ncbi:anti-sigma factor domain-containing protein [Synechococcus sp. MIT S9451]|uniref:anti-sigma factor domain-containing protein n=1 Tax=Synechococcus sp. MIT S9451 TaxID=3082543 RepID=UPI0039B6234A